MSDPKAHGDDRRRRLAALLEARRGAGGPRPLQVPEAFRRQKARFQSLGVPLPFFQPVDGPSRPECHSAGRPMLSFASYNYLGLADDPRVQAAARAAIDRYGTSVSASRIASGERPLHGALEARLAALSGSEAALAFVSGFGTNETVISHLLGPGDLIVHDQLIHSSVLQGALASGARRREFPHNDLEALDALLARERGGYATCLIVVEGLYSMDGDIADLPRLLEIKARHGAALMVDEAHSLGVLGAHGRGLSEHWGVSGGAVELWMGTLSKSLASCGGFIAASAEMIEYLRYTVPGFLYSVGLSPPNAAAALAALELMEAEPERLARLQRNARLFLEQARARGLETGLEQAHSVVPVMVGAAETALALSSRLFAEGINAQPAFYPAVPEGRARLRFFVTSEHTPAQIERAVARTAALLAAGVASGGDGR